MREGARVQVTLPGVDGYAGCVLDGTLVSHRGGRCIVDMGVSGYAQYRDDFVSDLDAPPPAPASRRVKIARSLLAATERAARLDGADAKWAPRIEARRAELMRVSEPET